MWRAMGSISRGRHGERGQTATEYVLVISVITVALAYFSYFAFFGSESSVSPVQEGLDALLSRTGSSDKNIPQQIRRGYVDPNPHP